MNRLLARPLKALSATAVAAVVVLGFTAGPALAQPSTSPTSNALTVSGLLSLTTGACTGSTTTGGTGACGQQSPQANTLVAVGVLTQQATNSAACAGATGPGGSLLQIGPGGDCAPAGSSGGINLLNGLITANAIYASCTPTPSFQLVGLGIGGLLGGLTGLLGLPTAQQLTAGGTFPVTLLGIPLLTISTGQPEAVSGFNGGAMDTITALDVNVLPNSVVGPILGLGTGGALHLDLGNVFCPASPVIPAFPSKGLPIAGGIVALAGMAAYLGRRRLFAAFRD